MKYSLIVDIGNSKTEFAIFKKEELIDKIRFTTNKFGAEYSKKFREFFKNAGLTAEDFDGGMIFSVVPELSRLLQIVIKGELGLDVEIFNSKKYVKKLKTDVDNPEEIGQDLIADIVGALHYYGAPVVVSDLGTVTKNIVIDKDGVFQGVSFFPGITLSAKILYEKTSLLPELEEVEKPAFYYGKNTIDAMNSGIFYCHVAAIRRFGERTEEEFGYKSKQVVTGGFSNILIGFFKNDVIMDPNLVLKGMYLIYQEEHK